MSDLIDFQRMVRDNIEHRKKIVGFERLYHFLDKKDPQIYDFYENSPEIYEIILPYTTDSNSFFELFCGQLSELYLNLQDRKEAIITLNSNWNKLDDNNKQSLEWNQFQKIIEKLKDWIIIYEEELNKFLKDLKERFYSL